MSLTRRYVAQDHERFCVLTFPDGLVPPLSVTLQEPSTGGGVVFFYDPGSIESMVVNTPVAGHEDRKTST